MANQHVDDLGRTVLFRFCRGEVTPGKGGQDAVGQTAGEIVTAANRARRPKGQGREKELVGAPGNVEPSFLPIDEQLESEQIGVGVL